MPASEKLNRALDLVEDILKRAADTLERHGDEDARGFVRGALIALREARDEEAICDR